MPKKHFDLIVIGAGPGGTEAALLAARLGLSTALVSNAKIGGRASWGSLLPSKVWLAAAQKADQLSEAKAFGLETTASSLDLARLRESVKKQSQAASDRYIKQLGQAGVQLYFGQAFLIAPKQVSVRVEEKESCSLSANNIILATGSGPRFLPELKPNKDRIIAPRLSPSLPEVPPSLIMAGGGVTGTEYAYAFAALGAKVSILQHADQLLPRLDNDISKAFEQYLTSRYDLSIHKGDAVQKMEQQDEHVVATTQSGKTYEANYGFIAIGRKTDLNFAAELKEPLSTDERGAVQTDAYGQTSIEGVYAIGDLTGAPMMANRATQQARIAVYHIKEGKNSLVLPAHYIEATYTHPPVGQIGNMSPSENTEFVQRSYKQLLKAQLLHETHGFVKLNIDRRTDLILGAAAFGAHAIDVLGILQIAINNNIKYGQLKQIPLAHPSMSEILSLL